MEFPQPLNDSQTSRIQTPQAGPHNSHFFHRFRQPHTTPNHRRTSHVHQILLDLRCSRSWAPLNLRDDWLRHTTYFQPQFDRQYG